MTHPLPWPRLRRLLLAVFMLGMLALVQTAGPVRAEEPSSTPDTAPGVGDPALYLPLLGNSAANDPEEEPPDPGQDATVHMVIDTDPGVDDAVALAWLFAQRRPLQVLGVVSVAGNAAITDTTSNALTMLEKLGRQDVPVIMGAAQPLAQPLSKTSYFIHGPDGLWYLGRQNPHDLAGVRRDAPEFYCATAAATAGVHILALGPLTNVAQAVRQCPDAMRSIGQLVILGGARFGGNQTPVAEFNFWQDPEAAAIVLDAGLPITLVLFDAFGQPAVTPEDLNKLLENSIPAIAFLAPALRQYADVQLANTGRAGIPDAVAAVVALQPNEGARQEALVRVLLEGGLARGQSIVGLTAGERVTMLATDAELSALAERAFASPPDPNFNLQQEMGAILMRAADHAQVVTSVDGALLTQTVLPDLLVR